jgi:hypothetical protein
MLYALVNIQFQFQSQFLWNVALKPSNAGVLRQKEAKASNPGKCARLNSIDLFLALKRLRMVCLCGSINRRGGFENEGAVLPSLGKA